MGVLAPRLPAQVLLGERRPFVGRLRLAADQQDRAVGAALAQLGGALRRGQATADEEEVDVAVRWALSHQPAPLPPAAGPKSSLRSSSRPGSSTASTSSPASSTVSGPGTNPLPSRRTEIKRLPS